MDYATLLTQEDVRAITGHKDATPMPESDWGMRAGSSKYFALYQAKDWPEAVWFRVGHKGTFEEARRASDTPAETIPGLGDDAFWWDYTDVQRGLAVLVGDTTYEIMTRLAYDKPQMTDDQMLEIAGRSSAGCSRPSGAAVRRAEDSDGSRASSPWASTGWRLLSVSSRRTSLRRRRVLPLTTTYAS